MNFDKIKVRISHIKSMYEFINGFKQVSLEHFIALRMLATVCRVVATYSFFGSSGSFEESLEC
ncbi:MAG: hypothetical protein LBB21_04290 [Holosporaceae bacterium]|jgi:hypothetical protein|nr:hypothetical protein [Holosporaceae bacterium]